MLCVDWHNLGLLTRVQVRIYAVLVWISLRQYSSYSLSPYVVSAFATHSLVSTTNMVCFVIAGVVQVPIAKFVDLTGRMEGFILMVFFMELGVCIDTLSTLLLWLSAYV